MSRSTSRPQRGVRIAFTRRSHNRLARAGLRVRMARKSDWIFAILFWVIIAVLAILFLTTLPSANAQEYGFETPQTTGLSYDRSGKAGCAGALLLVVSLVVLLAAR